LLGLFDQSSAVSGEAGWLNLTDKMKFRAFRLKVGIGFRKKGTLKQKIRAFKLIYLKEECSIET